MCFCFPFGHSNNKKRKTSSSNEKKRRDRQPSDPLRGDGRRVVAEVEEKAASVDRPRSKRSKGSPRQERSEYGHQPHRASEDVYRSRAQYRTPMHVEIPSMWYRPVGSDNSSQEMLLNPRPHRSQHYRQKHASQHTLRGHGKRVKSSSTRETSSGGWALFASSPPKTPKKRDHHRYQTLDSPSRNQRSHRQYRQPYYQDNRESSRAQSHRSRQHQSSTTRQATPNTAARRDPDRRFAVLAATNTALEDLRREAFAQSSPPPRRDRLRRYQGVTIPASSIPYSWDCVSSSQTSNGTGYGEPSSRHRRRR